MGLFSSKYVTQVGTVASRLIEDETIPNSVNTGTVKSFFQDGNIADYVIEELAASIGVRAERMYNYAGQHYVHGLPSGEVYSSTQGRAQVEAVIETLEGQQVLIEYSHFGPPNTLHVGWMKLVSDHGYSTTTNQLAGLTATKGVPVYLKDMVVVVPESQKESFEAGALAQWGSGATSGFTPERLSNDGDLSRLTGHSPINVSSTATALHLLVTYVWQPANQALQEDSFTISMSGIDDAADYFHAKYLVNNVAKYWMYKNDSGTYPTLDAVYTEGPAVSGSYFPFAYFRYNKQSVITNKNTDAYRTSKKLVKYLGIDYDLLAESIDENPDIADVEQAMLVMGVPAVSTNPIECRYLFEYFDTLHASMDGTTLSALASVQNRLGSDQPKMNTIVIKDAQFKMALHNEGIYKRIVAGSIGNVGTHTSAYETVNVETSYYDTESGSTLSFSTPTKVHKYRRQIAPGLYEEIFVRNLKMTYYVFQEYTTTADEEDDILLIPIDRTITENYSIGDRETLYARSLHMVFNSRVVTKVKWYQTGVFRALLIIVAVVITIYTYNADGGSLVASALGLSGTAGLVATIIVTLAIGNLLPSVFKLFVKVFGQDVATVIAILAIIYGGYRFFSVGGVTGAPWAEAMLQLSTGLQQAILQDKYTDLLAQADQFELLAEGKNKLLETAQELLDQRHLLSPFTIFGEKPEDFYNRTVHYGNIGTLGITAISSYVDIALTLPKLNDTLGDELNATL